MNSKILHHLDDIRCLEELRVSYYRTYNECMDFNDVIFYPTYCNKISPEFQKELQTYGCKVTVFEPPKKIEYETTNILESPRKWEHKTKIYDTIIELPDEKKIREMKLI